MPTKVTGRRVTGRPASPGYRADVLEVLTRLLAGQPGVNRGKMFGFPAFYTAGKLFACVYGEGIGLKLPEEVIRTLDDKPGVTPFQPYGKARMKEWIHIRPDQAGISGLRSGLLQTSIAFVRRLARPASKPG